MLLLAQIPLAVVQLKAPSKGPGKDFPQSCWKGKFCVGSPRPAVCAFCCPCTVGERQGGALGA